jgi:hypothetical protein
VTIRVARLTGCVAGGVAGGASFFGSSFFGVSFGGGFVVDALFGVAPFVGVLADCPLGAEPDCCFGGFEGVCANATIAVAQKNAKAVSQASEEYTRHSAARQPEFSGCP